MDEAKMEEFKQRMDAAFEVLRQEMIADIREAFTDPVFAELAIRYMGLDNKEGR